MHICKEGLQLLICKARPYCKFAISAILLLAISLILLFAISAILLFAISAILLFEISDFTSYYISLTLMCSQEMHICKEGLQPLICKARPFCESIHHANFERFVRLASHLNYLVICWTRQDHGPANNDDVWIKTFPWNWDAIGPSVGWPKN